MSLKGYVMETPQHGNGLKNGLIKLIQFHLLSSLKKNKNLCKINS